MLANVLICVGLILAGAWLSWRAFGPRFRSRIAQGWPVVDGEVLEIDLGEDIIGYLRVSEISRDRVEDARSVLKEGDEVTAVVVNVDRKTRNIQLSIKAKDAADQNEAMATLSQNSARENAGTTSLGALLRAKLDNN
jgi:small subunit ribosomal protein S1